MNRCMRKCLSFLPILVCVLSLSVTGHTQSVRGSIAGEITDSTGAAIVGADVSVLNTATGLKLSTVSTSSGAYRFPELPLGSYTITVTASGFSAASYTGVSVTVNSVTAQNIQLKPGAATETVSVTADALALQTESSEVGGTVADKQIINLPLALGGVGAMRSPQAFTFLLPGATGPGTASTASFNTGGVFLAKIGGGQNFATEVLLDGASQSRSNNGSSFDEEAPSVEALQEFKVTTAIPQAEYGRTTGGVESFVTKSGTNSFHGSAFDIFRNDAMDANTWFNNGYRALNCVGAKDTAACQKRYARPSDKQNDFGGSLGGFLFLPHVYDGKNKTFFFFSWEQFKQSIGASITSTVPTALERTGDFSQFLQPNNAVGVNPCDGSTIVYGQIFDPDTTRLVNGVPCRTPFAGNKIPLGRLSKVAQNINAYYPAAQNENLVQNFTYPSVYPLTNTTYTIRVDESVNSSNNIFVSYSTRQNTRLSGNPALPDPVAPNEFTQNFVTHFGRLGWDHIFTPNLLNHFNFGTNRANGKNYAFASLGTTNYSQQAGISNISSTNFPIINVGESIDTLGNGTTNNKLDNSLILDDSVNWSRGRHSFKFGFDVRYFQLTSIALPAPVFVFERGQTAADNLPSVVANSGNGFASFMLGAPRSAVTQEYAHNPRWIHWYYAGFAQDDVKVSNTLTLNLGMRYDVEMPRHEALGDTSNLSLSATDPTYGIPGAIIFGPQCHCNTRWANTWFKDISPRLGFAWAPAHLDGKTVLRGGGSIFYGPLQYNDYGTGMQNGFSVAPNPTSSDGFTPAFSMDNGFPAYQHPPVFNPGFFNGQPVNGNYIGANSGRPGTIYNWSLQVQQQLASDIIATLGYTGQHATHLSSNLQNINNIPSADFALGNQLASPVATNTAGVVAPFAGFTSLWKGGQVQQALRPFPQYGAIGTDCCLQALGQSSYDALLFSLQKQFRNGMQFIVSYTWAKNLTDADSALPSTTGGVQQIQNPENLKGEKALSIQDIPQTLVLSYLYDLPFGKGKRFLNSSNRLVTTIVGGWELGGIQRYMSGQPISFGCASGIPGWDNCVRFSFTGNSLESAAQRAGTLNPLLTPHGADPHINSLFNGASYGSQTSTNQTSPAFFDQNNPHFRGVGAYHFGNVPRVVGAVRMNPYLNEDFSLLKTFPIRSSVNFVLELEALNATNRHAWATPDVNPNNFLFGVPVGTITNPRQMQITGRITF